MVIKYRNWFIVTFLLSITFYFLLIIYLAFVIRALEVTPSPEESPLSQNPTVRRGIVWLIGMTAFTLHITSHYLLAKAKGYSGLLGVGAAGLGPFGLAVLFLLKDKAKGAATASPIESLPPQA